MNSPIAFFLSFALFSSLGISTMALADSKQAVPMPNSFCTTDTNLDKDLQRYSAQELAHKYCPSAYKSNPVNWNGFDKMKKTCIAAFDSLIKTQKTMCENTKIVELELNAMPLAHTLSKKHSSDPIMYKPYLKAKSQQILDITALNYELRVFYDLVKMRELEPPGEDSGLHFESIPKTRKFIATPTDPAGQLLQSFNQIEISMAYGEPGKKFLQNFDQLKKTMNGELDGVVKALQIWEPKLQQARTDYTKTLEVLKNQNKIVLNDISSMVSLHSGALLTSNKSSDASAEAAQALVEEKAAQIAGRVAEKRGVQFFLSTSTMAAIGGYKRAVELFASQGGELVLNKVGGAVVNFLGAHGIEASVDLAKALDLPVLVVSIVLAPSPLAGDVENKASEMESACYSTKVDQHVDFITGSTIARLSQVR